MKRDDTKKNFTSLSGNDLQTVRLHYPSFPCIIAIVPVSRLLNLMRYSSVLNANIRFFCSENRNFTSKGGMLCYKRWHLLQRKMVSFASQVSKICRKGFIVPRQRAPSTPQETLIRESQASGGDNIHSLL